MSTPEVTKVVNGNQLKLTTIKDGVTYTATVTDTNGNGIFDKNDGRSFGNAGSLSVFTAEVIEKNTANEKVQNSVSYNTASSLALMNSNVNYAGYTGGAKMTCDWSKVAEAYKKSNISQLLGVLSVFSPLGGPAIQASTMANADFLMRQNFYTIKTETEKDKAEPATTVKPAATIEPAANTDPATAQTAPQTVASNGLKVTTNADGSKSTEYVVQPDQSIEDLVKISLKAQGKENPTQEELKAEKEKFITDNSAKIQTNKRNGKQYLFVGETVTLNGEVKDSVEFDTKEKAEAEWTRRHSNTDGQKATHVAAQASAPVVTAGKYYKNAAGQIIHRYEKDGAEITDISFNGKVIKRYKDGAVQDNPVADTTAEKADLAALETALSSARTKEEKDLYGDKIAKLTTAIQEKSNINREVKERQDRVNTLIKAKNNASSDDLKGMVQKQIDAINKEILDIIEGKKKIYNKPAYGAHDNTYYGVKY